MPPLIQRFAWALALATPLALAQTPAPEPARADAAPTGSTWATAPTQTLQAVGVRYAYRELGRHHGGTPIVLLNHLAAVLDNWDPRVVDGLAAQHHVIVFDQRGVGASTGKPAESIEEMAQDALAFIDATGFEQVDLFGFSMGGMVAQELVLMAPQRVRRMILAGTGPAGGEGIAKVAGVANYDLLRGWLSGQDPKQYLFFTRSPEGIAAGQAFLARLQERTVDRDTDIAVGTYFAQLRALTAWGRKAPADLSGVQHAVLVVNGDQDRMVPTANSHELARRLPNSRLVIYPDAGHGGVFQHHADFVRQALAFLAR